MCCRRIIGLAGSDFGRGSAERGNWLSEENLKHQTEAGVAEGGSGPSAESREDQGAIWTQQHQDYPADGLGPSCVRLLQSEGEFENVLSLQGKLLLVFLGRYALFICSPCLLCHLMNQRPDVGNVHSTMFTLYWRVKCIEAAKCPDCGWNMNVWTRFY